MRFLFTLVLWTVISTLTAQTEGLDTTGVDTTGVDYQVGYQIGSWLPFIIVAILALMVINKTRNSRE